MPRLTPRARQRKSTVGAPLTPAERRARLIAELIADDLFRNVTWSRVEVANRIERSLLAEMGKL